MFKRMKDNISLLGLSLYKEILIFVVLNVVLIVPIILLIVFKVTNFIIIFYALTLPVADYLYLDRYKNMVKKLEIKHNNEFISLLSYFEIFISHHNNVYKCFEMLLPYTSEWMNSKIIKLLEEIDLDKSVTPFIRFSSNFTYLVIQNVMISIYQMVEDGEKQENLLHFDYLFSSLNNTLSKERIEFYDKNLDNLNAFPLIGAGLISVTLILSIVSLLGELTNVI